MIRFFGFTGPEVTSALHIAGEDVDKPERVSGARLPWGELMDVDDKLAGVNFSVASRAGLRGMVDAPRGAAVNLSSLYCIN